MDIFPILATLKRHKTAAGLIVLQVALTCAIVCNALFLIFQRLERINEPSGLAESEVVMLGVSGLSRSQDPDATTRADLQALRALPSVKSVALMNQIPYADNFWASGIRLTPEQLGRGEKAVGVANYIGSEGWLQTLGLNLVAGRDFNGNEYQDQTEVDKASPPVIPAVVINEALAKRLFPNGDAVGQTVYVFGPEPIRVVGVIERLVSPQPGGANENHLYSMVLPIRPNFRAGNYLLRTDTAARDTVLTAGAEALLKIDGQRIVRQKKLLSDMRKSYYQQDVNMAWLMGGVCIALLAVTAFGIVGLASFWVQQRTRMIGTRWAMGATRGQILRYFQTENFLLTTVGIALGMVAAYGISLLLMRSYELPRLPFFYLPAGALALWALGQIAVLAPARRAAALPPVAALRA
ncbi:MAG: ABC transporter permease [Rhodoferax sp.]|nr:ABC transporter permease [Rhodoferax sp.]